MDLTRVLIFAECKTSIFMSLIGLLKRAFGRSSRSSEKAGYRDLKDPIVLDVCQTCEMYQVLAATLTQLRMEIFAGMLLQMVLSIVERLC